MPEKKTIAIIGGGAAGMLAAIAAKTHAPAARILLLEQNNRLGKKLLSTGNGRCNFTNINTTKNNFHGQHPEFVEPIFEKFGVQDTIDFFDRLGVLAKVEGHGKVYPYSGQASSVLDVLRFEIDNLKIEVVYNYAVNSIQCLPTGFNLKGRTESAGVFSAAKVIVAAGGSAVPASGSDGSGFVLLENLGHTLVKPVPALAQLKTDGKVAKSLKGIKIIGKAKAVLNGKNIRCEYGDILFTEYGLSGPPILQLSRIAAINPEAVIVIDLMPEYDFETVERLIKSRIEINPAKPIEHLYTGMLNKRVGQAIVKGANIEKLSYPLSSLNAADIRQMAGLIKGWEFKIRGTTGFNNAQITAGGIRTTEFSQTLKSKIAPNLYAAGEVLDIDGDCGGFNLQWAWSSGYVAGCQAALDICR